MMLRSILATAVAVFTAAGSALADTPPAVHHVRGTIEAVTPSSITVSTRDGRRVLAIGKKTAVAGVVPATVADITSGAFIGTANVPGASATMARALEVVVFPPSMAGTGEGDYPWDLSAGGGRSAMTNGTVMAHRGSMMTNATVTGVNNGTSKVVTLEYKGGSKQVTIPPGTPIVRIVPGSLGLLTPGAHVFIAPGKDGGASRIVVGEQGAIPPM